MVCAYIIETCTTGSLRDLNPSDSRRLVQNCSASSSFITPFVPAYFTNQDIFSQLDCGSSPMWTRESSLGSRYTTSTMGLVTLARRTDLRGVDMVTMKSALANTNYSFIAHPIFSEKILSQSILRKFFVARFDGVATIGHTALEGPIPPHSVDVVRGTTTKPIVRCASTEDDWKRPQQ